MEVIMDTMYAIAGYALLVGLTLLVYVTLDEKIEARKNKPDLENRVYLLEQYCYGDNR
jgi:hypothetical protein